MTRMTAPSGYRERNTTADRALHVLQMFAEDTPEISAIDVATALDVARSTAYRYLETLVQSGFLTETGRGGFRLGLRVLELGRIARHGVGLTELCVPTMTILAERFHQTVLLTKLMGKSVVCLEREEPRDQYIRFSYERGSVLDINAGASALVLLSATPDEQILTLLASSSLQRFTARTLTDPEQILTRLAQIRNDGHAISIGEVDPTAMGIAAPIYRRDGSVLAALSIVLIRSLVDQEIDEIAAVLTDAASALGEKAALLEL